jgi:hypothetical protein
MPYSILGFITGLGFARSQDLEGSSAAKVAVIPGILGFNVVSLVLAKVVADQEAESLPPPDAGKATIEVDSLLLDFNEVSVGSSACTILAVSNGGTLELVVSETNLKNNDAGFAIASGGAPFTVAPGATHFVEVSFSAGSAGPNSASLDIISTDPDQPTVSIGLSGTGVNTLGIEVTPDFRNYGDLALGPDKITKCFIVSNKGDNPLINVTAKILPSDSKDFVIESGNFIDKIGSGCTHDVEVSFNAVALSDNQKQANLIITHDNLSIPITILLTGTVIDVSKRPMR